MGGKTPNLRLRLIGGALAPLVIAGACQALYSVVSQRSAAIDGLEAKANAVTSLLVDVAGPSIATDDPKAVDEGLGYFANDPDFEFALALSPDGKAIAFRGPEAERARRTAAARVTDQPGVVRTDDTLLASYPVVTGGKTIGEVVVGLRTANVEAKVSALTMRAALISLAGILAAVLVVLALAGRIARRNREMTALLDNMEQGFLSIAADGTLAVERSAMATRLIGGFQPGQTLWQALAPVDPTAATWLELGWAGVREGVMPVELSFDQLPKKLVVGGQVFRIEYKPTLVGETLGNTLVVITDATAELARVRAEAAERDLLRMIEQITRDRSGFVEFVAETDRLTRQLAIAGDQPGSDELKRDLHTLKGNCGIYGLSLIAERCHELEDHLAVAERVDGASAGVIAQSWSDVKQKLETVFGPNLTKPGAEVRPEELAELHDAIAHGASLQTIKQHVTSWSLERTRPKLERFGDQARGLAQRLEKGDLAIEIEDHGLRLDAARFRPFWTAFSHVVRNAVDHGLEMAADRVTAGKPERGTLSLATRRDGTTLVIEVRDDGRGLDWDAVRRRASAAGLACATHADLVAAILSDGLTTRDEVSETSGRGVGLAALRQACIELGGAIEVDSEPGKGARFCFRFEQWSPVRSTSRIPRIRAEA